MISLSKNQAISLTKTAGKTLTKIAIGLGWDPIKKKGFLSSLLGGGSSSIDLDASCVLLDSKGNAIDTIWFNKLKSNCGSVIHLGDNLTGDGDGDDEVININLTALPANVAHIAITVNSFSGQTFNEVDNAFCRVVDSASGSKEICNYKLTEQGAHTGILLASLSKQDNDWIFKAHGTPCKGRVIDDMLSDIKKALI